jgi:bla regulator protein BlaR1
MVTWVVYLVALSALLALAAWLAEQPGRLRHRSTRWIWLVAISASLLMPWVAPGLEMISSALPRTVVVHPATAPNWIAPRPLTSWTDLGAGPLAQAQTLLSDRSIQRLWIASSLLTILWIVGTHLMLRTRRHHWNAQRHENLDVLVSEDFGPVVIGVLKPRVVIPAWALSLPAATQRLILAHERSHLDAQDPRWLALALALVSLVPWNPFLWWQLHRLRLAIEVDCDRRVLRTGVDASEYAWTLLDCSVRRSTVFAVTAAMAEPASMLERRIALMGTPKKAGWSLTIAFGLLGAAGAAIAATQLEPPHGGSEVADAIQQYVGNYEFSSVTILKITRADGHLTAAFGQRSWDLIDQGHDLFGLKNVDASMSFARDGAGRVAGATLHQNGVDTPAPRISTERAEAIRESIEARIQSHQPATGSEASLRHLIDGLSSGVPDYSAMSPQLAGGTRAMLRDFQKSLSRLGAVQSIHFQGVSSEGLDQYLVQHGHGTSSWEIVLDDHGTIVTALWHAGT